MFCLPLSFLHRVGLIASVAVGAFALPASGAVSGRPNIILIAADDLG